MPVALIRQLSAEQNILFSARYHSHSRELSESRLSKLTVSEARGLSRSAPLVKRPKRDNYQGNTKDASNLRDPEKTAASD